MSLINSSLNFRCYAFTVTKRFTLTKRKFFKPLSKSPTLPPSKTKRYRVVEVPYQKPEDVQELLWRRHAYLDALSSIRFAYRKEHYQKKASFVRPERPAETIKAMRIGFDAFLQRVDDHNRMQAEKREERMKTELEEIEYATLRILEKHLRMNAESKARREKQVSELIAASNDFITPQNADEKISEAIETLVDYNYAVDADGNIYKGNHNKKYLEEIYMMHHKVSTISAPSVRSGKLEKHEDPRLKFTK